MVEDPFHHGERQIQEETGERDSALRNGRILRSQIQAGAIGFISQQEYCVLGWGSNTGELWATVILGEKGFAHADEQGQNLYVAISAELTNLMTEEPFTILKDTERLGALFIEFMTRRRLRINGRVEQRSDKMLTLRVDESYPNCPKYIQRRQLQIGEHQISHVINKGEALDAKILDWISQSDTFFVSSAHPDGRLDVSHRGGKPGFVKWENNHLAIPDYPGNSMFNTFGNFILNPKAGLCFVDFEMHCQLHLTGEIVLALQGDASDISTGQTGRWWYFSPKRWVISTFSHKLNCVFVESSPYNP